MSAWQAQRPRVRDEVAWARAILANAEKRRIAEASAEELHTREGDPPSER